jgi:hypothetical protein
MFELFVNDIIEGADVKYNLENLQYFTATKLKEIVEIFNSLPELKKDKIDIRENEEEKVYEVGEISTYAFNTYMKHLDTYAATGNRIVLSRDYADHLDLKNAISVTQQIARYVVEDKLFGNLDKLREGYFTNIVINTLIGNYMFLTKEDEKVLKDELPDYLFVIETIKNKHNKVVKNNINKITLEILKDTVKELGFEYEENEDELNIKF